MKRTKEQFIDEILFIKYSNFIYDIVTDRICLCDIAEHSLALESWLAEQFKIRDLIENPEEIIRYASECLIAKSNTNSDDDNYVATLTMDLIQIYKKMVNPSKASILDDKLAASSHLKWIPLTTLMEQCENT